MVPESGFWSMIAGATLGVQVVLAFLAMMSLWSWTIIFYKFFLIRRTKDMVTRGYVVFNDAALSLIALKQQARQLPKQGIDGPRIDFAAIARGCGVHAFSAASVDEYRAALKAALAADGPTLIDVRVDPSGYLAQSIALRG